jgi:hypothetical protein
VAASFDRGRDHGMAGSRPARGKVSVRMVFGKSGCGRRLGHFGCTYVGVRGCVSHDISSIFPFLADKRRCADHEMTRYGARVGKLNEIKA